MSHRILVLPNTMQLAYVGIDELAGNGMLSEPAALMLKALYAHGWDDGVVCLKTGGLENSTGMSSRAIDLAMYELLSKGLVRLRDSAHRTVIELLALSHLEGDVWSNLAWWHYCLLESDEAA